MKISRTDRSAVLGRRLIVPVFVAALGVGLGIGGLQGVLAGDSSSRALHPGAIDPVTSARAATPTVHRGRPSLRPAPSPASTPAPDPNALEDGVYAMFVRAVHVRRAEITVDVIQVFAGAEQRRAAVEDGVDWAYVMYDPVYVRNKNPLLRTLPVAWDVRILFYGWCDYPSRWAGLTELRREAASSGEGWYYDLTVVHGEVVAIEQKVASAGC